LVDRLGSRLVLTVVIIALAATVLGMTTTNEMILLGVAITLTRGFGQSALSVVSLAFVGKWFGRGLNYAMGVYSLLVGIGFVVAFPTVGSAALNFGWRAAWGGVGWILLLVLAPVAWSVARDEPEEPGMEFDQRDPRSHSVGADLTLSESLRSSAFWVFAASSSLFGLAYSGISLFNQSILEQRGFNASVYHTVLVISTLLGLVANFAGGWLASRWPIQRLMGLGMAVLGCALLVLPLVRTYSQVVFYGAAMGISGGVTVVFFSVWGQVYGRRHLGNIQGCAQMMTVFASAVGPLLLAETLQRTGSYDSMFYGLAAIVIALGVGSWLVRLPSRDSTV
jgi:MFS family permease